MANLNIVLLGKTGNGKSSTGNTILREDRFLFSSDSTSYNQLVERGRKVIGEYIVQVFDTPGPCDTEYIYNTTGASDIVKTCPLMESVIATGDRDGGVNAFFFVLDIVKMLPEEEMSTIKILEDIFGSDVFHEFGVLVFTHGDDLQEDFLMWCNKQDEQFKQLMAKFNNRVLMTINKGEFSGSRLQFSETMIEAAAEMRRSNRFYNLDYYARSERSRTILLINSIKNTLSKEFLEKIKVLEKKINKYFSLNTAHATYFFIKIYVLRGEIKNASQGTRVLDDLFVQVDELESLVKRKKNYCSIF